MQHCAYNISNLRSIQGATSERFQRSEMVPDLYVLPSPLFYPLLCSPLISFQSCNNFSKFVNGTNPNPLMNATCLGRARPNTAQWPTSHESTLQLQNAQFGASFEHLRCRMLKIQNFEKLWHMSPLDAGKGRSVNSDWVWRSKCNRLHLTVVEVISEFELLCSVVTLVLVHSWFFRLFRRIGFLAEFWVNTNGWLRRPWSGAADGFAQIVFWRGGVQLYVTDFVSGPTCSQAPRRAPLWGPFSVPILAVPGGAQLVTFNRPIWAIARSQRDLGWSWKRSAPASCKTI